MLLSDDIFMSALIKLVDTGYSWELSVGETAGGDGCQNEKVVHKHDASNADTGIFKTVHTDQQP